MLIAAIMYYMGESLRLLATRAAGIMAGNMVQAITDCYMVDVLLHRHYEMLPPEWIDCFRSATIEEVLAGLPRFKAKFLVDAEDLLVPIQRHVA